MKTVQVQKSSRTAEESRTGIRIRYVRPASYAAMGQFRDASSEASMQSTILDIGDGGVRILLTKMQPLEEETVIRLWIPLPDSPATVPVLAQVRWRKEKRREVYEVGLQFVLRFIFQ